MHQPDTVCPEHITPRCSVALVGNDRDIDELAKHFNDMDTGWIRKDADSGWLLSSAELEQVTTSQDAVSRARRIIGDQDKVMYVNCVDYAGVAVGNAVWIAKTMHVTLCTSLKFSAQGFFVSRNGVPIPAPSLLDPHAIARAARDSTDVAEVLKWLPGLAGNWLQLYNFAEGIGKVLPGRPKRLDSLNECVKRGWISQKEARRFKRSANQARHPANASDNSSMQLSEGRFLMRRIAKKLLLDMLRAYKIPGKPQ